MDSAYDKAYHPKPKTWRDKVHDRIRTLCNEAWRNKNIRPDGRRYKKHRPYQVPAEAQALVEALGRDDEELCKSILLYGFLG